MSSQPEEKSVMVPCWQNKRIYLYAVKYEPGMEDGFQKGVLKRVRSSLRHGERELVADYRNPLKHAQAKRVEGFVVQKKPVAYIDTERGREYLDEDHYIINPQNDIQRFVEHKFRFEDAYELAELDPQTGKPYEADSNTGDMSDDTAA